MKKAPLLREVHWDTLFFIEIAVDCRANLGSHEGKNNTNSMVLEKLKRPKRNVEDLFGGTEKPTEKSVARL